VSNTQPGHSQPADDLTHVATMWQDDRASAHLGIECLEVGLYQGEEHRPGRLGHARARMTVADTMVNGHDIAHGGYIFTLADSTFALACNAGGVRTVASACDITFVTSARRGDVLVADAQQRAAYGRSGITDVTVTREGDGALVAEFRGRSRSLPPKH
jgi:acyl-CoA thioesterase